MRSHIYLNNGETREGKTRHRTTGVARAADTLEVHPGESIGSIAMRAYGANTDATREKIERANARLEGTINVPR